MSCKAQTGSWRECGDFKRKSRGSQPSRYARTFPSKDIQVQGTSTTDNLHSVWRVHVDSRAGRKVVHIRSDVRGMDEWIQVGESTAIRDSGVTEVQGLRRLLVETLTVQLPRLKC